jgi:tetratricopeptide (TPR) repeat protein
MVAIPERGDLRETPLPRLLIDLYSARFDGSVTLTRERAEKRFLFQEGVPIFAESNLASETLGVQLMDAGRITRGEHTRVSRHVQSKQCREGTALLELGLLEPKALFVALKEQVRQRMVDCFGWAHGEFRVEPSASPPEKAQPFRADIYALIQEGIEIHWSADRILGDLAPHMETCVVRSRRLSRIQDRLLWDDAVQDFIDALDGTRTLWRALQSAKTPRALAAAWLLDAARALDYPEDQAVVDRGAEAEIEIEVTRSRRSKANVATLRAESPREDARGTDAVLVQEIRDKFAGLRSMDHYQLLGIESDAPADAIRRAYLAAAKRYHPDALARACVDSETRQCAGKVFASIGKAHAVLSDPRRRSEYDLNLGSDESDLDAERLVAAETNYRKAEILMRTGNFRGALEYLRPAAELWPEEAAYQAGLGWALFKKLPSEPETARTHLERAYALDAQDPQIAFWLGKVLDALGETDPATALIEKARELDPGLV